MKKIVVWSLVSLGYTLGFGSVAAAPDANGTTKTEGTQVAEFSDHAKELIQLYGKYPPRRLGPQPKVRVPRSLKSQHLTEEYRLAWEELLLNSVSESPRPGAFWDRIIGALKRMADPRSVAALQEAFERLIEKEVDPRRSISRQDDMLKSLIIICDEKALPAILSSLDLADKAYGDEQPTTSSGDTLREMVFNVMLQTKNPGDTNWHKKRIQRAEKWRSMLSEYDTSKLSRKNREFQNKAKSFKRNKAKEEKESR